MEIIDITQLCKNYGDLKVLDNLSVRYDSGNIYGLVGENGAGKSTLFNCLMGLQDYSGTITKAADIKIGFMPAETYFYPLISAQEHIEFCLKAKGMPINRDEINEMNRLFELPLNRYAANFSTGMKKKLMFMSLLLQKNDLLILDEPFNGVDLRGGINMRQLIKSEAAKGCTFIISSHLIASLQSICDHIDYLEDHHIRKRYTGETIEQIENDIMSCSAQ